MVVFVVWGSEVVLFYAATDGKPELRVGQELTRLSLRLPVIGLVGVLLMPVAIFMYRGSVSVPGCKYEEWEASTAAQKAANSASRQLRASLQLPPLARSAA